jgi:hypothetical protein
LRDNPFKADIDGWQALAAGQGYDPALIEQHLAANRR